MMLIMLIMLMLIVDFDNFSCFSSFMLRLWLVGVEVCKGGGGIMGIMIRGIGVVGIG